MAHASSRTLVRAAIWFGRPSGGHLIVGHLIVGGHILMGTDALESMGHKLVVGTNVSISLEPDTREETKRLFLALADGGKVTRELQDMFWGAYYGAVTDKFGVQWMVNCTAKNLLGGRDVALVLEDHAVHLARRPGRSGGRLLRPSSPGRAHRSDLLATSHYPESIDNPGGRPRGSVLTVEFEVAGQPFTALNAGPAFVLNPSVSFFIYMDTTADVERLYSALVDGGEALMPLGTYPWSERYGWVKDRFGVSWQVIAGRRPQSGATIAPCLLFAGAQHGKAEEAMRVYASIFAGGRVDSIERYAAREGPQGTVKHGRFVLAGQDMVAMDSHIDHGFTFNEALSLQVMCDDQAELDHYWSALAEGGEYGSCGWLKDRFGLWWQVGPTAITEWIASTDTVARDRAFEAMLEMKKLDIAALKRAFEGR